jgi:TM2 domain-containing membrane protein YozV
MGILTKSKNGFYTIPAIISAIIPGLGQIIKGHVGKGLVFLALALAWSTITGILGIIPFSGLPIFLATIGAWAINVLDAAFNSVGQRY